MADQLTAGEAARRLGVKPATLYAYVSRGILTRRKDPSGRTSRFDAGEIEDLARRGRPRRAAHAADIVIESALTEIDGAQFRYRGLDVPALATPPSFEKVPEFPWPGPSAPPPPRLVRRGRRVPLGRHVPHPPRAPIEPPGPPAGPPRSPAVPLRVPAGPPGSPAGLLRAPAGPLRAPAGPLRVPA